MATSDGRDTKAVLDLQAERRTKILQDLNANALVGVEIGALCRPLIRPSDGRIIYVDHADTATLREKYRHDPDVDIDDIVDVTGVWGENSLHEAIGEQQVDYVVASHVIEHVPDLITWLGEIREVLRPGGQLRLIVPDKRFTFDVLRRETLLTDLIPSYIIRARVPQPVCVFDFAHHVVDADCAALWRGPVDPATMKKQFDFPNAFGLALDVAKNGTYHDVHCWVFTPHSFAALMYELVAADLSPFACRNFIPTARNRIDIYATLELSDNKEASLQSWRKVIAAMEQ